MQPAANYSLRLLWKQRTYSKDVLTGQDEYSFQDNGYLWGNIEPQNGRRQNDFGAPQTGQDGTIRLRGYPSISALDQIYSSLWDELWIIDSVYRGDWEMVCDVHKFDALEGV